MFAINDLVGYISKLFLKDLMTFLKNYSLKYAKKDSKNDLSMLLVAHIIINTPKNMSSFSSCQNAPVNEHGWPIHKWKNMSPFSSCQNAPMNEHGWPIHIFGKKCLHFHLTRMLL